MGDLANDMVNGKCCELCGTYFIMEHGYPVICVDCWRSCDDEEKQMYSVATLEEM